MTKKLLYLFSAVSISANAQIAGPNDPTAATNLMCSFAYSSTVGYTPAGNVFASDNTYAMATHCDCCDQNTQCLSVNHFNFAIPTGATINGIVLDVEKKRSFGTGGSVVDNGVQLMKAGVNVGTNKMDVVSDWPTTDTYVSYGSPTDLWGTTWTPTDINAVGFGAAIASISYFCGSTAVTSIDHVRITVYYTSTTGVQELTGSDGNAFAYPIPATSGNRITFAKLSALEEFNLTDASGKEIFKGASADNSIVLPELAEGIYFVQIKTKDGAYKSTIAISR